MERRGSQAGRAAAWRYLYAGLALSVLALAGLVAQTPPSANPRLSGKVLDAAGEPVAGALVILARDAAQTTSSMTHPDGSYSISGFEAGSVYELKAAHKGLASRTRLVQIPNGEANIAIDLTVVPPIRFEDVSRRSGLNFVLQNGATGHFYQPEIMLGGVAAIDYNNDGCMDIFVTNGAELPSGVKSGPQFYNRLFRNNCDMTFTDVTSQAGLAGEGYSMGVAAADYDNDGFVDIFVTGLTHNMLYRNRGDGTFEDVTRQSGLGAPDPKYGPMWSVSAGWFDYDNDGLLDLFVSSYVAWEPVSDRCWMEGGAPFYCHPRVYRPLPNRLYHNDGKGVFRDVSDISGISRNPGKAMGVAFGDFNGDGLTDVFVANDSIPNFLFENLGGGKFKEVALEKGVAYAADGNAIAGMGADFRDFDDDGREDILLDGMYFNTFPLYRNLGKPNFFTDVTASSGIASATYELTAWGLGMFDFDNDGSKDLFFATSHFPGSGPRGRSEAALANRVLRSLGNRTFDDVSALTGPDFQVPALYHGAAFADFDNDGRVDAVVTAINSNIKLFRNSSPDSGHWMALRLAGSRSNRDGLGAVVRLTLPSGAVEYNRATTAVGYASSSEPLVHFGLGPHEEAREIQIRWPSGRVQVLRGIKGDRVISIKEPAGR